MKSPLLGRFHLVASAMHEFDLSMINCLARPTAGLLALLIFSSSALGQFVPPDATVEGKTMAEWAEAWALWAFGAPWGVHMEEEDLAHTHLGQDGPVWFIGTTGDTGDREKSLTVPADKYVLAPVIFSWGDDPSEAREVQDGWIEASFEMAGITIPEEELLTDYRVATGEFYYELPPPNAISLTETASGHVAFDGTWVMLEPLAPGKHTKRGGGRYLSEDSIVETIKHLYSFDDPADFDFDGNVGSADQTVQLANWTGASMLGEGERMLFIDGDTDFDGDIDTADQTILARNWTGAMAGNADDGEHAKLIYDPPTGHVTLDATDTTSGKIRSFAIGNAKATDWYMEEITDVKDMRPENAQFPFSDTGTNTDGEDLQIGQSDASGNGAGPIINLGEILPPDFEFGDVESLSEYLTLAEYASDLGVGGALRLIVRGEGDFNGDRELTVEDIDLLTAEIQKDEPRFWFDIDGNEIVDSGDISAWVELRGTFVGDADLDGQVNAADLNALALNWQADDATSWVQGDFNGDGLVNATDLNDLALNWRSGSGKASAVPEPSSGWLLAMVGLVTLVGCRRTRLSVHRA